MRALRSLTLAAALLLTGCGTTVPLTDRGGAGLASGPDDTLMPRSDTGTSALAPTTGASRPNPVAMPPSRSGALRSGSSADGGRGTTSTSTSTSTGTVVTRGVTATTVRIGVLTIDPGTSDEQLKAFGADGYNPGDTTSYWRAAAAWVNAHGGLLGRKVEIVFALIPIATTTPDTDLARACTTMTQDQPAYLAFSDVIYDDGFASCVTRAGLPLLYANAAVDRATLLARGAIAVSAGMTLDRLAQSYVDGLHDAGWFGARPTIGLVRVESPRYEQVARQVLEPALARHGFVVARTATVSPVNSGDYGGMASQMAAAVLAFQSAGVDHVLFLSVNATEPLLFMSAASSQQYRPAYGLTTQQAPSVLQGSAPADQMAGVTALGWEPLADVSDARDPGPTAGLARCKQAMAAGGADVSQRSAMLTAAGVCDTLFLAQTALAQVGRPVHATELVSAVERLGSGYPSVLGFAARFGPGRRDGASRYRLSAWDQTCDCMGYVGPLRPLP